MHFLGISLRMCPNDFRMKSLYGVGVDWPIGYDDLLDYYRQAAVRRGRGLAHRVRRPVGLLPAGRAGHGRIGRRGRTALPRHPLPEGLRLPDAQGTPELPGPGDLAEPQRHAIQVRAKDLRYLAH